MTTTRPEQPGNQDAITSCVIGAGPRGLSVLERIRAESAGTARPVTVHLGDPACCAGASNAPADRALHRYADTTKT